MNIRSIEPNDCSAIAAIYNHYIVTSIATFRETALDTSEMAALIANAQTDSLPALVALVDAQVVGYTFATKWKPRAAYRFSAECTVYVKPDRIGQGIGAALYAQLLRELRESGVHAAIGGIALPNDASVALHEKFGMSKVAHFKEVGFKFGRWIDVAYWEILLQAVQDR
ncbi:MAG: N-acetyltransferase family protein [Gemmatimonadaceae bacterium]